MSTPRADDIDIILFEIVVHISFDDSPVVYCVRFVNKINIRNNVI